MVKVFQEMCDGCGQLLQGMQGISHVKKDALHITGSIARREVDQKTKWGDYTFITPHKQTELTFCWDTVHNSIDTGCFMSYIENNFKLKKDRLDGIRRREAMEDATTGIKPHPEDGKTDYEIMKESMGDSDRKFGIGGKKGY